MDKMLLRELRVWETAKYDGVKGALPSWVPDEFRRQFLLDRYAVFVKVLNGECKYGHLQELLSIYESPRERIAYKRQGGNSSDPPDKVMTNLAALHMAVMAGEVKGMRMLSADSRA